MASGDIWRAYTRRPLPLESLKIMRKLGVSALATLVFAFHFFSRSLSFSLDPRNRLVNVRDVLVVVLAPP